MLKSSEAREKLCPLLRLGVMAAPHGVEHSVEMQRCQAESCMMWRGVDEQYAEPIGYCGLGGKPENL